MGVEVVLCGEGACVSSVNCDSLTFLLSVVVNRGLPSLGESEWTT